MPICPSFFLLCVCARARVCVCVRVYDAVTQCDLELAELMDLRHEVSRFLEYFLQSIAFL